MLLYLALAGAVYYITSSAVTWYRLRHFPGPFLAKFSYLWEAKAARTGRAVQIYADVCKQYGPLARIAPDVLLTDDPEVIRHMSATRSTYRRSEWYSPLRFDPHQHSMFSTSDTTFHDAIKAKTAAGYSGREIPGLESDVDEVVGRLQGLIRRKYLSAAVGPAKPMDLSKVAQWFTLDSLGSIAFGMHFGHLDTDSDVYSILKITRSVAPLVQMCTEIPILRKLVFSDIMVKLAGPKPTDPDGIGKLQGIAKQVTSKRFGPDAEKKDDMIGSFVRHGLTRSECESEILLQFVAGSDTTATTIRTTLLYLMTNVVAYKNLQAEIDLGVKDGRISAPIKNKEAKELPYLQAVLSESMRIHPSASAPNLKQVPPEGDVLCGKKVPGGTHIAMCVWSILRRKDIFGGDADVFRPERWLERTDPAKHAEMTKALDLNFGYGRWGCAGKQVAYMELNKVFVELLRYFDFQLVDPAHPWTACNHTLFYIEDMWVTVRERTMV